MSDEGKQTTGLQRLSEIWTAWVGGAFMLAPLGYVAIFDRVQMAFVVAGAMAIFLLVLFVVGLPIVYLVCKWLP